LIKRWRKNLKTSRMKRCLTKEMEGVWEVGGGFLQQDERFGDLERACQGG